MFWGALSLGLVFAVPAQAESGVPAQPATVAPPLSSGPIATIIVPEWKSKDGRIIVRLRARAQHDFFNVETNLTGTSNDVENNGDALRGLRVGLDGQFSPKLRFRADANLIDSEFNWVDAYLGFIGTKYELYAGQHRQSTTIETVGPDVSYALPETSLINTSFGQGLRSFGFAARIKGANWQTIGGIYSGNMNAGDMFGDDALQYAQVRSSYAFRNKDRDVVHVGASLRLRDARAGALLRYSARAAATNFGPKVIDSSAIASTDTTLSVEGLLIRGSLMVMGEYQTTQAQINGRNANLHGGYLESTWWLTGESRRYQASTGTVGQVKPKHPLGTSGLGALALVTRIEQLDQSDRLLGSRSGRVDAFTLGLSWIPIEYVMFRLATSRTNIDRPSVAQSGYVQATMARAQIAF
jgi:phosphate-selective porin OprO and OprP